MNRLTKGEINRLGERIRARGGLLAEEDRELMERVLAEHLEVLEQALERVRAGVPGVEPTPRLKSDKTLVEKLMREPGMDLARVEDIAGMRIVRDMTRRQQNQLASRIARVFEGAKVINRRADPRSGYRALHIRVSVESRFVEIQTRTELQNFWAQAYEAIGDVWGRQIRYGELPDDPQQPVPGDGTRAEFVGQLLKLSDAIADLEIAIDDLVDLEIRLGEVAEAETEEGVDFAEALKDDRDAAQAHFTESRQTVRDQLEGALQVLEAILQSEVD